MKTCDISIFPVLVCRQPSNLSPNRAIILIGPVVENPLAIEDGPYFIGKVLRLQSSLTIESASSTSDRVLVKGYIIR